MGTIKKFDFAACINDPKKTYTECLNHSDDKQPTPESVFNKIQQPKAQEAVFENNQAQDRPRIAVVDNFTHKEILIDLDGKPDLSHGEVVERFIEEGLPNAQIDRFNDYIDVKNLTPDQKDLTA